MLLFIFFQAIDLTKHKAGILEYVESRMAFIAPNLSIIVGPSTAAKIMGKLFQYWHSDECGSNQKELGNC